MRDLFIFASGLLAVCLVGSVALATFCIRKLHRDCAGKTRILWVYDTMVVIPSSIPTIVGVWFFFQALRFL